MFKDHIILPAFAGLVGVIGDGIIHWAAVWFSLAHTTTGHYLASIIYATIEPNTAQIAIGELAHLIAGATLGLAPYIMLKFSGPKYALLKGIGLGAVMWLNHVIFVPCLVAGRVLLKPTVIESLVDLVALCVWGGISALVIANHFGEKVC